MGKNCRERGKQKEGEKAKEGHLEWFLFDPK